MIEIEKYVCGWSSACPLPLGELTPLPISLSWTGRGTPADSPPLGTFGSSTEASPPIFRVQDKSTPLRAVTARNESLHFYVVKSD